MLFTSVAAVRWKEDFRTSVAERRERERERERLQKNLCSVTKSGKNYRRDRTAFPSHGKSFQGQDQSGAGQENDGPSLWAATERSMNGDNWVGREEEKQVVYAGFCSRCPCFIQSMFV